MAQDEGRDLFDTTRGKVLLLLCRGSRTVNELMDALGVTDNAVRAQLANLQQAGFVRQVGLRPGTRKPHADYELTPAARQLFPGAHGPVLDVLVDVLREKLPPDEMRALLGEAARRLLDKWVGPLGEREPERRAAELHQKLQAVAPGVSIEEQPGHIDVRACGCPLASVTATHPEICQVLAGVLGDLLGTSVRERCQRDETPRCCFEVEKDQTA